jgi:hypothetical protein
MVVPLCSLAALLLSTLPQPIAAPAPPARGLHRWIDFQSGTIETRYRYIESSAGETVANQLQHKQAFKGALKLDAAGRYTIQSTLATGNTFTGSWDPTGVGTGEPRWDFRVRRLYGEAIPFSSVEIAAGSFDVLRGETTEIIGYDNDAYIEGYRATVKRPALLYVDELSVTTAFVGDFNEPNVFERFDRMGEHNYSQVLATKRLTLGKDRGRRTRDEGRRNQGRKDEIALSADWSALDGVDTLRQGVHLTSAALRVVDGVRFEHYWRISGDRAYGFAVFADRAITHRLTAGGGFSHTDRNFPPFNGDRYGRGKRILTEGRLALRPELSLNVFYTVAIDNEFPIAGSRRFDVVLAYNILKALQQAGRW